MAFLCGKKEKLSLEENGVIIISSSDDEEENKNISSSSSCVNQSTKYKETYSVLQDQQKSSSNHASVSHKNTNNSHQLEEKSHPQEIYMVTNVAPSVQSTSNVDCVLKNNFSRRTLNNFISACRSVINDPSEEKIFDKIRRLHSSADPDFVQSSHFISFLQKKADMVLKDSCDIYVHIKDVYDELKAYRTKKHKTAIQVHSSLEVQCISDPPEDFKTDHLDEKESTSDITDATAVNHDDAAVCQIRAANKKTIERIKKLEHLLKRLNRKIKHLQRKELSLDELGDDESIYIQEDKFKKRFIKVWNKLCLLTGRTNKTGRRIEKRIQYDGSSYPEINKKVEKFVNKRQIFPDYTDIFNIVTSLNSSLQLSSMQVEVIAREVFEDIGKLLQKRRVDDLTDLMGCYLTDNSNNDPANDNKEMQTVLEENSKNASDALNKLLDSFVQKQIEKNLEPEIVVGDADKSPPHRSEHDEIENDDEDDDVEQEETSDIDFIEETLKSDSEDDDPCTKEKLKDTSDNHDISAGTSGVGKLSCETNSVSLNIKDQNHETISSLSTIVPLVIKSPSLNTYNKSSVSGVNHVKRKVEIHEKSSCQKKQCLSNENKMTNTIHQTEPTSLQNRVFEEITIE